MSNIPPTRASLTKKLLLTSGLIIILLLVGAASAALWVYRQQSAVLISSANRILAPYGVEVLDIQGLQTGLQQARISLVEFRINGQPAVQRIQTLQLDYQLPTLIRGQISKLSARSATLRLQDPALSDGTVIEISQIEVSCRSFSDCSGAAALSADVPAVNYAASGIQAAALNAAGEIDFEYRPALLSLNINPGLDIKISQARIVEQDNVLWAFEKLALRSNQTWRLSLDSSEQLLIFDGGQLHLNVPALRNQPDTENAGLTGFDIHLANVNGSYAYAGPDVANWTDRLTIQSNLELSNLYTTLQPLNLWSYRWPVTVSMDSSKNLDVQISGFVDNKSMADLKLDQNLDDGNGALSFNTTSLSFSPATDSLSDLISPLPLDADLIDGQLNVSANINWKMPLARGLTNTSILDWEANGDINIEAINLTGLIDETIFTGLSTSVQLLVQSDLGLVSKESSPLSIAAIDPGLPLTNVQTELRINTKSGWLDLSSLSLELFGGHVDSDPFSINIRQPPADAGSGDSFDVRINRLDISQVLGLGAYNAVSATGLVNGTLPVRLRGLKPVIENGRLTALLPGGSIRYDSGDAATGNPSLDLVYQALKHYLYSSLTASVDYNESGELTLAMQLQGESPELDNGQRINLNLNITDNIPALLQSLKAAQGITDRLEELLE